MLEIIGRAIDDKKRLVISVVASIGLYKSFFKTKSNIAKNCCELIETFILSFNFCQSCLCFLLVFFSLFSLSLSSLVSVQLVVLLEFSFIDYKYKVRGAFELYLKSICWI